MKAERGDSAPLPLPAFPNTSLDTRHTAAQMHRALRSCVQIKYILCKCFFNFFKGTVHPKIKNTDFSSFHVVLFISPDYFGVSYLVLEKSAVEVSAFSQM